MQLLGDGERDFAHVSGSGDDHLRLVGLGQGPAPSSRGRAANSLSSARTDTDPWGNRR